MQNKKLNPAAEQFFRNDRFKSSLSGNITLSTVRPEITKTLIFNKIIAAQKLMTYLAKTLCEKRLYVIYLFSPEPHCC